MLNYEKLKEQPRRFPALTGLTHREFEILLPAFTTAYAKRYPGSRTQRGKARPRAPGGGRTPVLASPEAQLLFFLVYQKTYPLQMVQGELFGLSQSQTNYWIHHLLPVLQAALAKLGFKPEREGPQFAKQERRYTDRRELIMDGTNRRRQRPKNSENRLNTTVARRKHTPTRILSSRLAPPSALPS